MGFEHLSAVLNHAQKGGSHLNVLLIIASYSDQRGEWVADQPTLQKQARLGRRRVQQLLAELTTAGELAVIPGDGRGHRSTYRLLLGPERAQPAAHHHEPCALSALKSEAQRALSHPPSPPCPSFPPDPQYSLNPPYPPKTSNQETFGLPPAPAPVRQAASAPAKACRAVSATQPFPPLPAGGWAGAGRGAGGEVPLGRAAAVPSTAATQYALPGVALPTLPFPPLPAGARVGDGRGAGGEGAFPAAVAAPRPLTPPQSAVFRTNLLLEEHAVPLPTPAQIGLWSKTLGGIEPLLDLLRRLIHAGLANKRAPLSYIHRVVLERAARPEPFSPLLAGGGAMGEAPGARGHSRRPHNPLLTAGVDDRRREQALRIIAAAKRGECW